jgi:hypothetical protein
MRAMRGDLDYDVMLEARGVIRSQSIRLRLDREMTPGETLDLKGRSWVVTRVDPARSLRIDRRVVAREVVPEAAAS